MLQLPKEYEKIFTVSCSWIFQYLNKYILEAYVFWRENVCEIVLVQVSTKLQVLYRLCFRYNLCIEGIVAMCLIQ